MQNTRIIKSACRMCHGGCQVLVHMEGEQVTKITGDPESPTSRGYICRKGAASAELLYHPNRVLQPLRRIGKRGEHKWEPISWDEALDEMTERLLKIKQDSGPQYFGMLQGTGRPYENLAARFANAFGTPNFTGVGHICFWPRVYANIFTQGMSEMPVCDVYGQGGVEPQCVMIWGCNITGPKGHNSSDGMCGALLQKVIKNAQKVIIVDPRRISPAENADYWLQLRPGSEGALALAMINVIIVEDLTDREFVNNYTIGFKRLQEHIKPFTPEWAEGIVGVSAEDIRAVARTYATVKPACMQWGNGIDHSMCNFHTARSLLIIRAITGNLHVPGGDIVFERPQGLRVKFPYLDPHFSGFRFMPLQNYQYALDRDYKKQNSSPAKRFIQNKTLQLLDVLKYNLYPLLIRLSQNRGDGQVLKLLAQLTGARYPLSPVVHPPTFWRSIVNNDPYRIQALWIMGANPLLTMSNSLLIEEALKLIDYIVVSDFFITPTAHYADLFLPASTWLEYDEIHNSGAHTFSVFPRKEVVKIGDTLDDQEVMIRLAQRLGMHDAFPWHNHQELTDWMLEGTGLSFKEFCEQGILTGKARYYAYEKEKHFFHTPSGKLEIYSNTLQSMGISPLPIYREPAFSPISTPQVAEKYPLILIGGVRMADYFHSEGRQINSLRHRNPDPLVEINPKTAISLGCSEGDWVWIETPHDRVKMRAKLFDGIAENVVCAQYAWWFPEEAAPEHGWKKSSINLTFGEMDYDPETGSESLKSMLCRIYPVGDN